MICGHLDQCIWVKGHYISRSEVNETLVEVIGQYVAAVFDDVIPDYVTVGDGKNYSSNVTNVRESQQQQQQQQPVSYTHLTLPTILRV